MGRDTAQREEVKTAREEAMTMGGVKTCVEGLTLNVAAIAATAGEARDMSRDAMREIKSHVDDEALHGCPSREDQDKAISEMRPRLSLVTKGLIIALTATLGVGGTAIGWALVVSNSAAAREARVGRVESDAKENEGRSVANAQGLENVRVRLNALERQRQEDAARIQSQLESLPDAVAERLTKGRRR